MKAFLATLKGKIIAGASTVATVAVVAVIAVIVNSGYRTIAVDGLTGTTNITNGSSQTVAYLGQHLKSGDDVQVAAASDLTLALDSDKMVYAKENTHFIIKAKGKQGSTKTNIELADGSTLCRIDNVLEDSESFDVDTPNATMSVRGTVFRVSCYKEANGETYTVVDVLEGKVFIQVKMETGENTEESRLFAAGERAVIRSSTEFSEFVKGDSGEIDYHSFSQNEAKFLGKSIDEGRTLTISKELLFDYVALIDHKFEDKPGEEFTRICTICGLEIHDEIAEAEAQAKKEAEAQAKKEAEEQAKKEAEEQAKMEAEEQLLTEQEEAAEEQATLNNTVPAPETNTGGAPEPTPEPAPEPTPDPNTGGAEPTPDVNNGAGSDVIISGDDTSNTDACANGHNYVETSRTDATCTSDGTVDKQCSVCGATTTETLTATGHAFNTEIDRTEPTCTSDGTITYKCDHCDAENMVDGDPMLNHEYLYDCVIKDESMVPPTHTVTCAHCDYNEEEEHIALPDSSPVRTPDGLLTHGYECICGAIINIDDCEDVDGDGNCDVCHESVNI